MLRRFWKDRAGATAIEYGLIIALLSLVIAVSASLMSDEINRIFDDTSVVVQEAMQ